MEVIIDTAEGCRYGNRLRERAEKHRVLNGESLITESYLGCLSLCQTCIGHPEVVDASKPDFVCDLAEQGVTMLANERLRTSSK